MTTPYDFKALGKRVDGPSRALETFPAPSGVKTITFTTDEVTSYCPVTHQPDFSHVTIDYDPRDLCLESKSLKLYLWSFRDETAFCEALAAQIAADIKAACRPKRIRVTVAQKARGGLALTAVAELEGDDLKDETSR